ncbi:MAG TPA: hypothetical protein VGD68_16510, partial [Streptosporangiaceae bacterium]
MRMDVVGACSDLLIRQSGVVDRQQALRVGVPPDVIDGLLRTGRWQRMEQGVYATFSGQPDRDARLWAVVLRAGPGAMLSHRTAAGLSGLIEYPGEPVHVIVPRDRCPRRMPGVIIHRFDRPRNARHPVLLPPRTRIEETVLDLVAAARNSDEAFGWVFRTIGQRLTTAERLRRAMSAHDKMRWRRELIACLDDAGAGVQSNLEHRYVLAVER